MTTNPQQHFADYEWSFHKIPKHELRAAWFWELERSLGSQGAPWLLFGMLGDASKRCVAEMLPGGALPAIQEYNLEKAHPDFVHLFRTVYHELPKQIPSAAGHHELHLLSIDWSCSKTKIFQELSQWVEIYWAKVPDAKRRVNKGGRKDQFGSWLVDLAIYRVAEAGFTRKESIKLLKPLLIKYTSTTSGKTSASHWEDAQRRTCHRLARRKLDLEVRAIVAHERGENDTFPREWQGYLLVNLLRQRQVLP